MATIRKEIRIEAAPDDVWAALADVGAVHTRLARGFVVDTRLEDGARVVTFANGLVARELIVTVDAEARRLVWAVVGGRMTHHNASLQAHADGPGRTQLVWIADLLPHELAPAIEKLIEQGMTAMKTTLEGRAPGVA
jgi:carbon monoxide dehydrogenase subunit G